MNSSTNRIKKFLFSADKLKYVPYIIPVILFTIFYFYTLSKLSNYWELANGIAQDVLITMLFFYLFVYIPERRKIERIKKNLQRVFKDFKLHLLRIILHAGNFEYTDKIEHLLQPAEFKRFFDDKRWAAVGEGLKKNPQLVDVILDNIALLREEMLFALNNADIANDEVYYFFKRSTESLDKFPTLDHTADDVQSLMDFMWTLFTGFDWINGYLKKSKNNKDL
jgi:hypothetical protein